MNRTAKLLGVTTVALLATSSTYAGLDGQTVSATLTSPADSFIGTPQFPSPVTIGPEVEFSTIWSNNFDPDIWTIDVDFSNDSLTLSWTESTHGQTAAFGGNGNINVLGIDLTFNQPILSNVSFSSLVSTSFWAGHSIGLTVLTNDASSIDIQFHSMFTGDIYTFDITTIPEPSSLLLAATGLSLIGLALRRRKLCS